MFYSKSTVPLRFLWRSVRCRGVFHNGALLDHLEVERPNIIGFSLGGAVALEMALQRPNSVPRLALINSLASYRIDHWRKWLEARVSSASVSLLGMRFAGRRPTAPTSESRL
jgi:pimeloyl-ACP methyl ester carboxylesterase